jgi:hypothetical protein
MTTLRSIRGCEEIKLYFFRHIVGSVLEVEADQIINKTFMRGFLLSKFKPKFHLCLRGTYLRNLAIEGSGGRPC